MSLYVASIASGSNGNCYYIGNHHEAVIVDAGISCRETEKRMKRLGLKMTNVKAIFISHEHGDHIRGVEVLAKKYSLPVYITPATLQHSRLRIPAHQVLCFRAYEQVSIGALTILPFTKLHDAADPHSFVVSSEDVNVGIFTDIGEPCEHVIENFKQCHAIFLETNYDEDMLAQGRYPYHLKKRISGAHGHLSNRQALELFLTHRPQHMTHVFLSHLSQDNNAPELVHNLFSSHANDQTSIIVASRHKETDVYHVNAAGTHVHKDAVQALLF
jgi:phosphoribosyl 1,2-cyclic phosphodiesterase